MRKGQRNRKPLLLQHRTSFYTSLLSKTRKGKIRCHPAADFCFSPKIRMQNVHILTEKKQKIVQLWS
jgi:hypothetical protein